MTTATQSADIALLRAQAEMVHEFLEGTMAGVTAEQAHWVPPGIALPLGAHYVHVVQGQDDLINGILRREAPLHASSWRGRTGVSEPQPGPDPKAPGIPDWSPWARRVRIDLPAVRRYAQAVYAATDAYLASLRPQDMERPVDLSVLALGTMPASRVLTIAVLGNPLTHCGEIACLKGLQGAKGYPF